MKIYRIAELKEETKINISQAGFDLLDSQFFNEYELYLFKANENMEILMKNSELPIYQMGFQRSDTDFADIDQQNKSNPPDAQDIPIKKGLEWIENTIKNWIDNYGELIVMSHSDDKNKVYKKILDKININNSYVSYFDPMENKNKNILIVK